ncbi:MAG TPA: amidohydrolase family protein [Kineosporiaceae bacterium]|nr:amidohydrolase family protein [Kineosporiaceae bacterium]
MLTRDVAVRADESDVLRARLAELGLPGIVDVHTHFMPKPVMDKVWGYFDRVGPLTGRPWPIAYRHSESERLRILRSLGVRYFSSLVYPHKPGMAEWLNEWCAEFAAATPGCLHTATFYPEAGAPEYVRAAIQAGARVFKAHVQVGDYDPNDPLLDGVWGALQESRTPIIIHSGHGPAPGRFTGPVGMEQLLARFPDLVLIVAHMGLPDYGRFLDLCERYDAIYLDTTMAFTPFTEATQPFPRDRLSQLRDLGARVVFGSDFPNIPYTYLDAVDAVLDIGPDLGWVRGVLHDNACRLLGLPLSDEGVVDS